MNVSLPYGDGAITVRVPDGAIILHPNAAVAVDDPSAALNEALERPTGGASLRRIARAGATAAVVVSDITRPVPNSLLLPPILEVLESGGVRRDDVAIVIGTGLHRASRPDELERILGRELLARYRTVDHDARDRSTHEFLLTTPRGVDVWVNREYAQADIRVLTGFVEPHLFAGYSGGGKAMLPGICGAESIMANHDARMIGHARATWCVTGGNPIFEEMRDVALKSEPHFTLNVTLDPEKRVTGIFAGELVAAHDAAMRHAEQQYVVPIDRRYDVVVVTNMGYPADLSLYQSVKGMSVAAQACAEGGAILLVAECREGLGGAEYVDLMRSEASPRELLARLDDAGLATVHDQWQVQVQAMVQSRCDVWLHSSLDRATVESAHLRHAPDVDDTLEQIIDGQQARLGREPTVCVLPYGQLTVPRLS